MTLWVWIRLWFDPTEPQNAETSPVQAVLGSPTEDTGPERVSWTCWELFLTNTLTWKEAGKESTENIIQFLFKILRSSLSPKGTRKHRVFLSHRDTQRFWCERVHKLHRAVPQACGSLSSQHSTTLIFIIWSTGLPRPFLLCCFFLHQSLVTISSSICNSLSTWVINQNFLTESWRPFLPTSPPPNPVFPLAVAHGSFPLFLF